MAMDKLIAPFFAYALACLLVLPAISGRAQAASEPPSSTSTESPLPDSQRMEIDLQNLPWPQFKSVVEAIPKLKADIEAYGSFGWQFVQANYTRYGWKKKIDRLDEHQKRLLSELIAQAHKKIPAMSGSGD